MPEDGEEAVPPPIPNISATPFRANEGGRHFHCKNCGAALLYKPGEDFVKCPYCGTVNEIPKEKDDSEYLKENDFLAGLEMEEKRSTETGGTQLEVVHCPSCGATTTLSNDRTSERCPYCGNPIATQNHFGVKLSVQAVLPFQIDSEKAMQLYRGWLQSRWFAPNDFLRRATREKMLDGIYMPYWTYDADTRTEYTGQRGDAYYIQQPYTVVQNGRTVTRTRSVRQVRWSAASGVVDVSFDDVLVPASSSMPPPLIDKLEPWNLGQLKPFQSEYLSGFITETYKVTLKQGFDDAKVRMAPLIDAAIRRDIGGDEQRIISRNCRYDKVTYKHIILPVWMSAYVYGGETYRFIINAQTGEISGERPWSYWKIGLAIAAGLLAVGVIVYFLDKSGAFDSLSDSGIANFTWEAVIAVEKIASVSRRIKSWLGGLFAKVKSLPLAIASGYGDVIRVQNEQAYENLKREFNHEHW